MLVVSASYSEACHDFTCPRHVRLHLPLAMSTHSKPFAYQTHVVLEEPCHDDPFRIKVRQRVVTEGHHSQRISRRLNELTNRPLRDKFEARLSLSNLQVDWWTLGDEIALVEVGCELGMHYGLTLRT